MKVGLSFIKFPNSTGVYYRKRGELYAHFLGRVSKDPLNGTWANSKSVRVFKTRQAAAENLL